MCQGTSGFEFGVIQSLNIGYLEFTGCGKVLYGGAMSINRVDMFLVKGCHFINNHVTLYGGAVFVNKTVTMHIEASIFNNNSGTANGGAICVVNGFIFTIKSIYINNSAGRGGGAIYVESDNISSTSNHYLNNSAFGGGAILVYSGKISSTKDNYINNSADIGGAIYGNIIYSGYSTSNHYANNSAGKSGGTIFVYSGNIYSANDYYMNNSAAYFGGAIVVISGNFASRNDHYINNSAEYAGGVLYMESGNIISRSDHYISNSALYGGGGAIYDIDSSSCNLCNSNFTMNTADVGAVIYKVGGILEIRQTNITNNFASKRGTLYLNGVTLMIAEGVNIINNRGSLYVSSTRVQINGAVVFMNNLGDFGGAITASQSQIIFNTASMVTIRNNKAIYGGGIYLAQSNLYVYHPFELTDNKASEYGGGIYASRSEIEFTSEETQILEITNNTAVNGGALCAIASNIQIFKTSIDFNSNTAIANGGAMYLGQNSKIYLLKNEPDYVRDDNLHVRLNFTSNCAENGGAIFVADNTNDGVLCQGANTEINQAECFIQTLSTYSVVTSANFTFINTFFTNNTAYQSGSDIYGGLLDQCTINPGAELLSWFSDYKCSHGFDYIKATTQIEQIIDYSQYARSHPDYLINNISKSDVIGLISSDGILKFCLSMNNVLSSKLRHPTISKYKGELFTVSVVVVDHVGNPVNATVSSSLSSESGNGHFKGGQVEQQVGNKCTGLEYNVYSQDSSGELYLHLYAEGPCGYNIEVSKLTLNLTFLPCECPVGFQPSSSQTECICECD